VDGMTRGLFVPLQANFFSDDRIVRCSRMAQLIYLQGLTIAKNCGTDGLITFAQLERECGDIPDLDSCVNELTKLKLWRRKSRRNTTVTFEIGRWLTHNKSQEWIEAYRSARAEDGKRGGRPPKAPESEKGYPLNDERVTLPENGKGTKGTVNLETDRQTEAEAEVELQTDVPNASPEDSRPVAIRLRSVRSLYVQGAMQTAKSAGRIEKTDIAYRKGIEKEFDDNIVSRAESLLDAYPTASDDKIVDLLQNGNKASNSNPSGCVINGIPVELLGHNQPPRRQERPCSRCGGPSSVPDGPGLCAPCTAEVYVDANLIYPSGKWEDKFGNMKDRPVELLSVAS
jgi:hypothetical protein